MADVLLGEITFSPDHRTYEQRQLAVMEDSYKVLCDIRQYLLDLRLIQSRAHPPTAKEDPPTPITLPPKGKRR